MKYLWIASAFILTLAGCGGDPSRLTVTHAPSVMEERVSVRSLVLADISLPEYANGSDVVRETEQGLIEPLPGLIWADIPEDAMANDIVRHLSSITDRPVARAPWPLSSFPDAELTIRADEMLLRGDGVLRLTGQFALSREDNPWSDRIRSFDVRVPVRGPELSDIADAHAQAWRQLAEQIAQEL